MAEIDLTFARVRQYKDLSLSFGRNPVTSDVIVVTGADAVKRAIKNLIMTTAGEVPFFPELGSRLNRLLFEPIDAVTTALLIGEITDTIHGFEPRAKILTLNVTPVEDESRYQVDITLQLLALTQPITLTLFLSRLR